jgi:RNA polymerase primary sigma factor
MPVSNSSGYIRKFRLYGLLGHVERFILLPPFTSFRDAIRPPAQILGREPSDREIAATLGWTEEYAALLRGFAQTVLSLDAPAEGEDAAPVQKTTLISKDDPAERAILTMLQKDIDKALKGLSPMERKVITLRYGLNGAHAHTLKETGAICGISYQRVNQIEAKALRCLRTSKSSHVLIGYREGK